jgi:glutathione-regulated potassium-efflux system ancillary protein KefC
LFDVMIYLAAAVVFVPLASRFRLGSVLGYLIAGCAIGPWGLRLVRDVESILHFSEFGVVLMLFLIGLELEPKRLFAMRRPVFGGGGLQLAACGGALALAALPSGLPWRGGVIAGLALGLSSTAIAVQTMRERGLLGSPTGRMAFSVLLFQDIAAIPLIALVTLLAPAPGTPGGAGFLGIVRVVGAIAVVVLVGRYLTRPLMRLVAKTGLRELFTAFALLLVVGIAQIMAAAGISMALGAFLAGVLLASSEYRHALESDIEPFKGLLMGLFFIAVGMSIDFGLVASRPLLVAVLVVGLLAIKGGMLRLIAAPLGVPAAQRWQFAALLSQGGEFAFVVFGLAGKSLLPGDWSASLTLTVALSMAATPLLLLAQDRLTAARSGRQAGPADAIEHDHAPVIIAGFGRFGQIVGRLLFASGMRATVLDHDPDQIEMLRKFGFRVFYGDATRLDLLHAAGAGEARLLVLAIDDPATSVRLVEVAREHFPHLQVVARARNISHWVALRSRGLDAAERETFEGALRTGRRALERMGVAPYEARERADRFRRQNQEMLENLLPRFDDEAQRLSVARAGREQLERQFAEDKAALDRAHGGWSEPAAPAAASPGKAGAL